MSNLVMTRRVRVLRGMVFNHFSPRLLGYIALLVLILAPCMGSAKSAFRTIQGSVRASNGEPLRGAVVLLEDVGTLGIRSYITERGGGYRFNEVSADRDYELKASFRERWSATKYVSRFSEGNPLTVDLTIDPEK